MIGVSHNRVKPASGHELLPPALGFRVMQSPGRITKAALGRADHVIVVVPHRVPASAWRDIPGLKSLQAVHRRLGKEGAGRALRGTLGGGTAVTLGALPFFQHTDYQLHCVVRDEAHEEIGEVERKDSMTDVMWLPLLPINMALNAVDLLGLGTSLGLTREGWNGKQMAVIETLFRSTMVEVRDRILKVVKERRAAEAKREGESTGPKGAGEASPGGDAPKQPEGAPDQHPDDSSKDESTPPPSDGSTDDSGEGD